MAFSNPSFFLEREKKTLTPSLRFSLSDLIKSYKVFQTYLLPLMKIEPNTDSSPPLYLNWHCMGKTTFLYLLFYEKPFDLILFCQDLIDIFHHFLKRFQSASLNFTLMKITGHLLTSSMYIKRLSSLYQFESLYPFWLSNKGGGGFLYHRVRTNI